MQADLTTTSWGAGNPEAQALLRAMDAELVNGMPKSRRPRRRGRPRLLPYEGVVEDPRQQVPIARDGWHDGSLERLRPKELATWVADGDPLKERTAVAVVGLVHRVLMDPENRILRKEQGKYRALLAEKVARHAFAQASPTRRGKLRPKPERRKARLRRAKARQRGGDYNQQYALREQGTWVSPEERDEKVRNRKWIENVIRRAVAVGLVETTDDGTLYPGPRVAAYEAVLVDGYVRQILSVHIWPKSGLAKGGFEEQGVSVLGHSGVSVLGHFQIAELEANSGHSPKPSSPKPTPGFDQNPMKLTGWENGPAAAPDPEIKWPKTDPQNPEKGNDLDTVQDPTCGSQVDPSMRSTQVLIDSEKKKKNSERSEEAYRLGRRSDHACPRSPSSQPPLRSAGVASTSFGDSLSSFSLAPGVAIVASEGSRSIIEYTPIEGVDLRRMVFKIVRRFGAVGLPADLLAANRICIAAAPAEVRELLDGWDPRFAKASWRRDAADVEPAPI